MGSFPQGGQLQLCKLLHAGNPAHYWVILDQADFCSTNPFRITLGVLLLVGVLFLSHPLLLLLLLLCMLAQMQCGPSKTKSPFLTSPDGCPSCTLPPGARRQGQLCICRAIARDGTTPFKAKVQYSLFVGTLARLYSPQLRVKLLKERL